MLDKALKALKDGDNDAIDEVYQLTYKFVYAICLTYMKDHMLAEDMMQNTYIIIREKIRLYHYYKNPEAWIKTICKNTCLNELKRRNKVASITLDEASKIIDNSDNPTPLINLAIECLEGKELEILLMHIISGMKLIDISKILKLNENTTRWYYHEALKKLKNIIDERSKQ